MGRSIAICFVGGKGGGQAVGRFEVGAVWFGAGEIRPRETVP